MMRRRLGEHVHDRLDLGLQSSSKVEYLTVLTTRYNVARINEQCTRDVSQVFVCSPQSRRAVGNLDE